MTKAQMEPSEKKASLGYLVNTDDAQGIIEAVVNIFGIIDLGKDIIHNGAYTKTLNERGAAVKVRVLDSHNTDSIMSVIGIPLEVREIGREELARIAPQVIVDHPEATGGLFTRTQFLMNTPEGDGAYKRAASRAVDEWSIALDPLQVEYRKVRTPEGNEITVRDIFQIRLYEYSLVLWGMNQATVTTDVKSDSGTASDKAADIVPEQKQATLGTRLEASMRISAAFCIIDWLGDGSIDSETVGMLNAAVETSMSVLRTSIPASVADMPLMNYWAASGAAEGKAGRMISGPNREKIQQCIDALQELMDASATEDAQTDTTDEKAADEVETSPVTGSQAKAASIIELADIDREMTDLTLMMEMA